MQATAAPSRCSRGWKTGAADPLRGSAHGAGRSGELEPRTRRNSNRLHRSSGRSAYLNARPRLEARSGHYLELNQRAPRLEDAIGALAAERAVPDNLSPHQCVPYRINVTQPHVYLSLRPTGLADGLALKEQRYLRSSTGFAPTNLGPRFPGLSQEFGV